MAADIIILKEFRKKYEDCMEKLDKLIAAQDGELVPVREEKTEI